MATTEDPRARADGTAEWKRELYDAKPEREGELFTTISGLDNEPLYTPDNVEVAYERELGYPGVYPFTRTRGSAICSTTARQASRRRSTCRR